MGETPVDSWDSSGQLTKYLLLWGLVWLAAEGSAIGQSVMPSRPIDQEIDRADASGILILHSLRMPGAVGDSIFSNKTTLTLAVENRAHQEQYVIIECAQDAGFTLGAPLFRVSPGRMTRAYTRSVPPGTRTELAISIEHLRFDLFGSMRVTIAKCRPETHAQKRTVAVPPGSEILYQQTFRIGPRSLGGESMDERGDGIGPTIARAERAMEMPPREPFPSVFDPNRTRRVSEGVRPEGSVLLSGSVFPREGHYIFPGEGTLRLTELLAAAGCMPLPTSKVYVDVHRTLLLDQYRFGQTFSRELSALFAGGESDLVLRPGDRVMGREGGGPPQEAALSEVIERDVTAMIVGIDSPDDLFLDLDSGRLATPRSQYNMSGLDNILTWMSEFGCEACYLHIDPIKGLLGNDLFAASVDSHFWAMPFREYSSRFAPPTQGPVAMGVTNGLPATFLFETASQRKGILQITELTDDPPRIRIRYRLTPEIGPSERTGTAASVSAEPVEMRTGFRAAFSNGTLIQVVGVRRVDTPQTVWWDPDGTPLSKSPWEWDGISSSYGGDRETSTYEIILGYGKLPMGAGHRLSVVTTTPPTEPNLLGGLPGRFEMDGKRLKGLTSMGFSSGTRLDACTVRVGLATGPWSVHRRYASRPDGTWGSETQASPGESITVDTSGSLRFPRSTVTVTLDAGVLDYRVLAVSADGKAHEALDGSDEYMMAMGGTMSEALSRRDLSQPTEVKAVFEGLHLDSVQAIEVQTRPYEWVEFEDLKLSPRAAIRPATESVQGSLEALVRQLRGAALERDIDTLEGLLVFKKEAQRRAFRAWIESDPSSAGLWGGRGEVYFAQHERESGGAFSIVFLVPMEESHLPMRLRCVDEAGRYRAEFDPVTVFEVLRLKGRGEGNALLLQLLDQWEETRGDRLGYLRSSLVTNWEAKQRAVALAESVGVTVHRDALEFVGSLIGQPEVEIRAHLIDALSSLVGRKPEPAAPERLVEATDYRAELENGLRVELIALAKCLGRPRALWWLPDGTFSREAPHPVAQQYASLPAHGDGVLAVFRVQGGSPDTPAISRGDFLLIERESGRSVIEAPGRMCFGMIGQWNEGLYMQSWHPVGRNSVDLRLGIRLSEWETVLRAEPLPDGSWRHERVLTGIGGVEFYSLADEKGQTRIRLSYTPRGAPRETRVVAYDHSGARLRGSGLGVGYSGSLDSARIGEEGYDVALDQIAHIELQSRAYRWVEFKDVKLEAGAPPGDLRRIRPVGPPQ